MKISTIASITVAILISVVHFNIAQARDKPAKSTALACGKELMNHCSGVPVRANNMLDCLRNDQGKLSLSCAALANRVVLRCEKDALRLCQDVVAGRGNVLGCLTTAKRSVSTRCNGALDAAFLRQ